MSQLLIWAGTWIQNMSVFAKLPFISWEHSNGAVPSALIWTHSSWVCVFPASIFTCARANTGLQLPFGVLIVCRPRLSSCVSVMLAGVSASRSRWDQERSAWRRLPFHMSTGHKQLLMSQNNWSAAPIWAFRTLISQTSRKVSFVNRCWMCTVGQKCLPECSWGRVQLHSSKLPTSPPN